MTVDRAWFTRNLGYDPMTETLPVKAFAFRAAATSNRPEDLQREIIDFDSEAPAGLQFLAFSTATGLSRFKDVPWPAGQAPITAADPGGNAESAKREEQGCVEPSSGSYARTD